MMRRAAVLLGGLALTLGMGVASAQLPVLLGYFQQGSKLVFSDASGSFGCQGSSVSLSADGNTAIVGGPGDGGTLCFYAEPGPSPGAAWIYTRSNGIWMQQGPKLVGTGGADLFQGSAVALSADGNTALVGGPGDSSSSGAAWVFTRSNGVWTQQGSKLTPNDSPGLSFGRSVALSADGNTAAIAGPQSTGAWVFTRSTGVWTQQGGKLTLANPSNTGFGTSVALSGDGNTMLVGAPYDSASMGEAWIFTRTGGAWSQQTNKLQPNDSAAMSTGQSVALSADGNTAALGAPATLGSSGATWVFTKGNGTWTQQSGRLIGSGGVGAPQQGSSVSLSGDGSTLVVGGPYDTPGPPIPGFGSRGAAWVFQRSNGVWAQFGPKLVATTGGSQGHGIAISSDASTVLMGAPDYFQAGPVAATWPFVLTAGPMISALSPGAVLAGSPGFVLTVNGANFQPGAVVSWQGTTLATTFVSIAQLNATVPQNLITFGGTATIVVTNADGFPSAQSTLTINTPPSNVGVNVTLPVPGGVVLSWSAASGATSYDVYFGTSSPPPFVINTTSTSFSIATNPRTTYYYAVLPRNAFGTAPPYVAMFTTSSEALRFVPVTPCRLMDTRLAAGTFGGPMIPSGGIRSVSVPQGVCNIPSTAQAYSLNLTAAPAGPLRYLTVWPAGQNQPLVSTLNSFDGRIVANAAIVAAGAAGAINLYASDPSNVIVDVNGYFAPVSTPGSMSFYPATPCRVVDTRGPAGAFGSPLLTGGSTRSFAIPSSSCGIPATAQAYSVNMTVVPRRPLSYLTMWPAGQAQPFVSTLNAYDGGVVANAAIVAAGTNGAINVYVTDDTDVIIDINGYFGAAGSTGALSLYTVTPCRVADTRLDQGTFGGPIMLGGQSRGFAIPGSACGVPAAAQGYALNVTVLPYSVLEYLEAWPMGQPQPLVSTLNSLAGKVVANAAIVAGSSGVNIFTSDPSQVILDIIGFFAQ